MAKALTHWVWDGHYWLCKTPPNDRDWHTYGTDSIDCPGCLKVMEWKRKAEAESSVQDTSVSDKKTDI